MSVTTRDYNKESDIGWCPGCGNFGILEALKAALVELGLAPHRVLLVSGIGQGPKLPHYVHANGFEGLHGRELPHAVGAKMAADDLTVIVHAGDGGAYGEGGNHLLHAIRRNVDLTLIVHDNKTYGLTKGQASPTTEQGTLTRIQPEGVTARPLNPLALAVSQSCAFVAQSMSADKDHLKATIKAAIETPGFSLLNVLQPCVIWDKIHTYAYYQERCFHLGDDHDPFDRNQALYLALSDQERIPLGIIYRHQRPVYEATVLMGVTHPLRDRGVDPEAALKLLPKFV